MTEKQPLKPANLVFKTVNGKLIISSNSIAYAKADGNYAKIVTFEDENLVLESLLSLERRLSQYNFFRVDRSTVVNLSMVYRLDQRLQICTLKATNGNIIKLKLSKHGIEQLMEKV